MDSFSFRDWLLKLKLSRRRGVAPSFCCGYASVASPITLTVHEDAKITHWHSEGEP